MFYVYEHIRNDNGECFYIGKGKDGRFMSDKGRSKYWQRVVKKAGGFKANLIAANLTEPEAFNFEILMIDAAKKVGAPLCNIAKGGKGSSGFRHTKEYKEAIRKQMLEQNPMSDPVIRERHKVAVLTAMQRPEVRKKQSENRKGKPLSKSHVENLKLCHPMKACIVNGKTYISLMEASRQLGIRHGTLKRWMDKGDVVHTKKYEHIKECRWA